MYCHMWAPDGFVPYPLSDADPARKRQTYHPAVSVATAGEAPYMVTAGDKEGYVYIMRYGCQEPHVPLETRQAPPPNRPSGFCTIL